MKTRSLFSTLFSLGALGVAACDATIDIGSKDGGSSFDPEQQAALINLQSLTGGPLQVELSEEGGVRVLSMSAGHNLVGLVGGPDDVASSFLAQHAPLFRLSPSEADDFEVTRVDADPSGLRHVTLQRAVDGIPVFQGAITVHMDASGSVFSVLGDERYLVERPTNTLSLSPEEAIIAAANELGLFGLNPQLASQDGLKTTFTDALALDIATEPRVYHVAPGDDRFVQQVLLSWKDDQSQLQYELALVDATTSEVLHHFSLVNTLRAKVFANAPTGTSDTRITVDFPSGWVDSAQKTKGNNVFAATDLNANNSFGTGEVQPSADANGDFFFPWSPASETVKEAAVVNLFYHNNLFHDHLYALGFTETSGNFQSNNFGRGGAGNDEVQADAQDGSGTNNANFATPPDGSKPRMQMFLFTFTGGNQEDSDFDAGIIYHEYSHGLSNRLVGGGSTGCLFGTQSGGMGEGWGDFLAASFLDDPVVGAYVTNNPTRGIRSAPLNNHPGHYGRIKDGSMTEVHDAGEIWAATLWDIRNVLGAQATERLVVAGMKLTPCNPTMLQARDAIIQADQNINGGANKCTLWTKFAGRQMGAGASSPNHNSTSTIVLSSSVPSECSSTPPPPPPTNGNTQTFTSTDINKAIPDNNQTGITSTVSVPAGLGALLAVKVDVNITHTYRGDLIISLIAPDGKTSVLSNKAGGSADNFVITGQDVSSSFVNAVASGVWTLKVQDVAAQDVGTINLFKLTLTTAGGGSQSFTGSASPNLAIPDNNTTGISSTISSAGATGLQIQSVQVRLNITHTWRGDLVINLTSPAGESRAVVALSGNDSADNVVGTFTVAGFTAGSNGAGNWTLQVSDKAGQDVGTLVNWSLGVNANAP